MTYGELRKSVEVLTYRDKLRLAQVLIQLARKEEETQSPRRHAPSALGTGAKSWLTSYVAERVKKLRPARKEGLLNSISAMLQSQGGISEQDRERVVAELQRKRYIKIDGNNRVSYPEWV